MTTNTHPEDKVSFDYILGLLEGDGSLLISISVKPDNLTGYRVRLSFSIALHVKDIKVLYEVQKYLGVGSVEADNKEKDVYRFIVRSRTELERVILPLLRTHPMVLAKRAHDCSLFLRALELMLKKEHITEPGLTKIRLLNARLSGKMAPPVKLLLEQPNTSITPEWFQGFVQAEGSFYAQIVKNATSALGKRVIVAFDVSQELCELPTVFKLRELLGCGTVVNQSRHPSLRVQSRADLIKYVFPFFEKYPVIGSKGHRLRLLREIVNIMEINRPLTLVNLQEIQSLIGRMKDVNY